MVSNGLNVPISIVYLSFSNIYLLFLVILTVKEAMESLFHRLPDAIQFLWLRVFPDHVNQPAREHHPSLTVA